MTDFLNKLIPEKSESAFRPTDRRPLVAWWRFLVRPSPETVEGFIYSFSDHPESAALRAFGSLVPLLFAFLAFRQLMGLVGLTLPVTTRVPGGATSGLILGLISFAVAAGATHLAAKRLGGKGSFSAYAPAANPDFILTESSASTGHPPGVTGGEIFVDMPVIIRNFPLTGSWEEVGVGSASGGGISDNAGGSCCAAIAVTPGGTPYVAWTDNSSGIYQIYIRRWIRGN